MKSVFAYFGSRLAEPSTYAGLAACIGAASAGQWSLAAIGAAAVLLPDDIKSRIKTSF